MADLELRARLAAHAMQGLLASLGSGQPVNGNTLATRALDYADGLLAKLEVQAPALGPWGTHWEAMARTCCCCKRVFADVAGLRDHIGVCVQHPIAQRCTNAESDRQILLTALDALAKRWAEQWPHSTSPAYHEAIEAIESVRANMTEAKPLTQGAPS